MAKQVNYSKYTNIQEPYKQIVADIVDILKGKFADNLLSIILYGSVARAMAHKESDIDFLIIARSLPLSYYERIAELTTVKRQIRQLDSYNQLIKLGYLPEPSFIVIDSSEVDETNLLLLDIAEYAVVLHDSGFMTKTLSQTRDMAHKLEMLKHHIGKRDYYWQFKKPEHFKVNYILTKFSDKQEGRFLV